ncbi:MAG: tetratricopeptide repeat protein [Gemmatales bacterium]|nr:tetratricopeptide repeat protein [Gemmatales bacterium]MDW8386133.1 tetratricopeptide repeat protein [Gemmatales bacterium]
MRRCLGAVTAFLTALFMFACKTEEKVLPPGTPLPEGVTVEKADKQGAAGPKRLPKATTCVSAAQVLEDGGDLAEGAKKQQLYDQAIAGYRQALEIDPKCSAATIRLARLYEKLGQMPRAVATFEQGLKNNPKDAAVWSELGMYHGRRKNFDESIRCLRQAVALDPQNQTYNNNLGWCLARAGRFDESYQHFARLFGPARAHYNVARMARHMGREDVCRHHATEALRHDPNLADARQLLESPTAEDSAVRQATVEFADEP